MPAKGGRRQRRQTGLKPSDPLSLSGDTAATLHMVALCTRSLGWDQLPAAGISGVTAGLSYDCHHMDLSPFFFLPRCEYIYYIRMPSACQGDEDSGRRNPGKSKVKSAPGEVGGEQRGGAGGGGCLFYQDVLN